MARRSKRSWLKEMAGIHNRPLGADPPVPWWRREVDRLKARELAKEAVREACKPVPPPSPPTPAAPVLKGFRVAAVYALADGREVSRWLTEQSARDFLDRWALDQGWCRRQNKSTPSSPLGAD